MFDAVQGYHQVEVLVGPRFTTKQRVDAPASIDPRFHTSRSESIEDFKHNRGFHEEPLPLRLATSKNLLGS